MRHSPLDPAALRKSVAFPITALAAISTPATLHAESGDSSPPWFEHNGTNAWLQAYDPTLVSRRAVSELTYEGHDLDGEPTSNTPFLSAPKFHYCAKASTSN